MEISIREFWTVLHGMGFGAVFLLAFAGGLAGLYSLRPELVSVAGLRERIIRLRLGTGLMAAIAWLTVVSGTWLVYIWYRAKPPASGADVDLTGYPRSFLLSKPNTAGWHQFGMEWKEHVAWIVPMVATAVFAVIMLYGGRLAFMPKVRKATIWFLIVGFGAAAVAGVFGAFINKLAGTR